MIDLHHHILFGIDDGSKDENMSLKMLQIAVEEGITDIIATPHYIQGYNQYEEYSDIIVKVEKLNELAKENNLDIRIYPGNEVYMDYGMEDWVKEQKVVSLNYSNYLLVETNMSGIPDYIDTVLYQLQLKDIQMILAHPERYRNVQKKPNILVPLIEKGMFVQMNTGSIMGLFGEEVRNTAKTLIKHNMVHFISTDAHSDKRRAPKTKEAYLQVCEWVGEAVAKRLFEENPRRVLENFQIPYEAPREIRQYKKKKKRFSKLFAIFNKL